MTTDRLISETLLDELRNELPWHLLSKLDALPAAPASADWRDCPFCKFEKDMLVEPCVFHKRIDELAEDAATLNRISNAHAYTIAEMCKELGDPEAEDPVYLARVRMEELRGYEEEPLPAAEPQPIGWQLRFIREDGSREDWGPIRAIPVPVLENLEPWWEWRVIYAAPPGAAASAEPAGLDVAERLSEFVEACKGHEVAYLWRLSWLSTLLDVCDEQFEAIKGDDLEATYTMLGEVADLHRLLTVALAATEGRGHEYEWPKGSPARAALSRQGEGE